MVRLEMITQHEVNEIEKTINSAGRENLLKFKAPVDRRLMINDKKIWIHYLPDFDEFSKKFLFFDLWKKIPETLEIKADTEVKELSNGTIVTKYHSETFPALVKEKILQDNKYIDFLLEKYQEYKCKVHGFLMNLKSELKIDKEQFYNSCLNYASLILDKVFPYSLLEQLIQENFKETNILYHILTNNYEKPVMREIHEGLVKLAEQEMYGEKLSIDWFINNLGYYGRYNLSKAELEYEDNVRSKVKSCHFNSPKEIAEYEEESIIRDILTKTNKSKAMEKIQNLNNKNPLLVKLTEFVGVSLDYNEGRRKVITRMFKYFSEI